MYLLYPLPLFNYTDDGDPAVISLITTMCLTVLKGSAGSVIKLQFWSFTRDLAEDYYNKSVWHRRTVIIITDLHLPCSRQILEVFRISMLLKKLTHRAFCVSALKKVDVSWEPFRTFEIRKHGFRVFADKRRRQPLPCCHRL